MTIYVDICKYKETNGKRTVCLSDNCEVIYDSKYTEAAITFLELFEEFKVVSFCDL